MFVHLGIFPLKVSENAIQAHKKNHWLFMSLSSLRCILSRALINLSGSDFSTSQLYSPLWYWNLVDSMMAHSPALHLSSKPFMKENLCQLEIWTKILALTLTDSHWVKVHFLDQLQYLWTRTYCFNQVWITYAYPQREKEWDSAILP